MGLTKTMNTAINEELHKGSFEPFKAFFDSTLANDCNKNIAEMMEKVCKKAYPEFKPLTSEEKERRRRQHEKAKEAIPHAIYDTLSGAKNVPNGTNRSSYALFYGMKDTPEDKARMDKMLRIYNEGTAKERHELFLSVMNDFASFNLDEYCGMDLDQKLENLPKIMPMLYKAMESESLIKDFKGLNCGITPQEEARFTTLYKTLHAYAGNLHSELDMVLSPYYPDLDLMQINLDDATKEAISDGMKEQGYRTGSDSIDTYMVDSETKILCDTMMVTGEVFSEFQKNGVKLEIGNINRCTPEGEPIILEDDRQYEKALKNGETLYFMNCRKDSAKEMLAVHDIYRKGYPTVISMERARELNELQSRKPKMMEPVKKPNGFVRFFDSINRMLGGKGFKSVNKYNLYIQNKEIFDSGMKQYQYEYNDKLKEIRAETVKHGYTDSFNNAVKEVKSAAIWKHMSRGIASAYLLKGKLTPEQTKWAKENTEAFREGFSLIKEDIIAGSKGKLSQDDKDYLAEIDSKAQLAIKSLESKEEPKLTDIAAGRNANEKQQQVSSMQKTKSDPVTISLP